MKITKKLVEELKARENVIVFKNSGFIKIVAKNGDVVLDWINEETLKFAVAIYDKLDCVCDEFYKDLAKGQYTGSNLEKIAQVEKDYSDHDKAVLRSVNKNKLMGF